MSRLIDADDLRQVLEVYSEKDSLGHTPVQLCDAMPTVDAVPKWIPCSERLPEVKGDYLVTYHPCYWDNVESEIKVGIDSFRGKTAWAKRKYQRVIAWMPLPEPYKAK